MMWEALPRRLFGIRQGTGSENGSQTEFVRSIFDFTWDEKLEDRNWQRTALSEVPELVHAKKWSEARSLIEVHRKNFTDFDFLYLWSATIMTDCGEIDAARHEYELGVSAAKEKYSLCAGRAMLEFKHGTLRDAAKWWIRSVVLQIRSGNVDEVESFLYLGYIAKAIGDEKAASMLIDRACRGSYNAVDLSPQGQREVFGKVTAAQDHQIPMAIATLMGTEWMHRSRR